MNLVAASAGIPCAMVTMSWRRLADAVIDAGGLQAELGGADGGHVAAGTRADNNQIVFFTCHFLNIFSKFQKKIVL